MDHSISPFKRHIRLTDHIIVHVAGGSHFSEMSLHDIQISNRLFGFRLEMQLLCRRESFAKAAFAHIKLLINQLAILLFKSIDLFGGRIFVGKFGNFLYL